MAFVIESPTCLRLPGFREGGKKRRSWLTGSRSAILWSSCAPNGHTLNGASTARDDGHTKINNICHKT